MKWLIYNFLFGLVYLLMLPKFVFRMLRRGGYARHFLQRIGLYNDQLKSKLSGGGRIWVHAVSVGEMSVALRVMQELRLHKPDVKFVVSTNTSTAFGMGEAKLPEQDVLIYFPLDCPPVSRRVVRLINPQMLLLTECELWPNLIRRCHKQGIPVMLYNGRLSDSSYKGYRTAKIFFTEIVNMLDAVLVQGDEDRNRMIDLGAEASKVFVEGTVKYDMSSPSEDGAQAARDVLQGMGLKDDGLIFVAGSTWAGEEEQLVGIFKRLKGTFSGLKLVLVPRHAERRAEVSAVIEAAGLSYVQKTDLNDGQATKEADVLLVDTTGELMSFYAAADVVFVGKSLTQHGGQNFIEPALMAKAIIVGPNLENFPTVKKDFLEAKAMIQVENAAELESELKHLLEDSEHRLALGLRAAGLVKLKSGSARRVAEKVLSLI